MQTQTSNTVQRFKVKAKGVFLTEGNWAEVTPSSGEWVGRWVFPRGKFPRDACFKVEVTGNRQLHQRTVRSKYSNKLGAEREAVLSGEAWMTELLHEYSGWEMCWWNAGVAARYPAGTQDATDMIRPAHSRTLTPKKTRWEKRWKREKKLEEGKRKRKMNHEELEAATAYDKMICKSLHSAFIYTKQYCFCVLQFITNPWRFANQMHLTSRCPFQRSHSSLDNGKKRKQFSFTSADMFC